jgi:hypothetical protein
MQFGAGEVRLLIPGSLARRSASDGQEEQCEVARPPTARPDLLATRIIMTHEMDSRASIGHTRPVILTRYPIVIIHAIIETTTQIS